MAGAAAVGVISTAISALCAVRFMMSLFPAAERRRQEEPYSLIVSATDPWLQPVRRVLKPVRPRGRTNLIFKPGFRIGNEEFLYI